MSREELIAARAEARVSQAGRAEIVLVIGAPCSGKSTYVREHAEPGDLIVDYDRLAEALGSTDSHEHPETLWPYVLQAQDAVLDRVTRDPKLRRVWLVRVAQPPTNWPRPARTVRMDTSREECHRRADAAGRPERWHGLIDAWFR